MDHLNAILDVIEGPPTRAMLLLAMEYDAGLERIQKDFRRVLWSSPT